ncbi:hypothetical protein [Calothrix sp. 336/3]|nr:hypothetical protein [Calothrix sp. 336/3]
MINKAAIASLKIVLAIQSHNHNQRDRIPKSTNNRNHIFIKKLTRSPS